MFVLSSTFRCAGRGEKRRSMGRVLEVRGGHGMGAPEQGSGNLSALP